MASHCLFHRISLIRCHCHRSSCCHAWCNWNVCLADTRLQIDCLLSCRCHSIWQPVSREILAWQVWPFWSFSPVLASVCLWWHLVPLSSSSSICIQPWNLWSMPTNLTKTPYLFLSNNIVMISPPLLVSLILQQINTLFFLHVTITL